MQIAPFQLAVRHVTRTAAGELFRYVIPADTVLQLEYFSVWNVTDTNARYWIEKVTPEGNVPFVSLLTSSISDMRAAALLAFLFADDTMVIRNSTDTVGVDLRISLAGWWLRGVEGVSIAVPN